MFNTSLYAFKVFKILRKALVFFSSAQEWVGRPKTRVPLLFVGGSILNALTRAIKHVPGCGAVVRG